MTTDERQASSVAEGRPPTVEKLDQELRDALEEEGHRFTTQRAAVYRTLGTTTSHPTADEIFTSVRQEIPDISLATVYKALEALVSCGLAIKLTAGEGPARYDSRTDEHYHLRCLACGSVSDLDAGGAQLSTWLESLEGRTDFELLDYRLELLGHCPRCRS